MWHRRQRAFGGMVLWHVIKTHCCQREQANPMTLCPKCQIDELDNDDGCLLCYLIEQGNEWAGYWRYEIEKRKHIQQQNEQTETLVSDGDPQT